LTPVAAYLGQDDIIRIALEHGVDMITLGKQRLVLALQSLNILVSYGFLSEYAAFTRKVEQAGLAFVGPSSEVIDGLGDKTKARTLGESQIMFLLPPLTRTGAKSYERCTCRSWNTGTCSVLHGRRCFHKRVRVSRSVHSVRCHLA
jgi:pyruvate carboxylase